MAALIRHGFSHGNSTKCTSAIVAASTSHGSAVRRQLTRHMSKKVDLTPVNRKLRATQASLAAKGFLRPQKAYEPPQGTIVRIDKICRDHGLPTKKDTKIEDLRTRFEVFTTCAAELGHSIPNSVLCSIETVGQLKEFYMTPVNTTTPYDALLKMDLPKNMHIQKDYHRFNSSMDTMFGGKTAFPKSSTIVTGLKYKDKYPGHKEEHPYLDVVRPTKDDIK